MKKPRKLKRCAKAARRTLKAVAAAAGTVPKPNQAEGNPLSVDELESTREDARMTRFNETLKRNAAVQQLPRATNRRKTNPRQGATESENLEADQNDFFAAIDAPLFKVCGSCGELANATSAVHRLYEPAAELFSPLRNEHGVVEVIDAGRVNECADAKTFIRLCDRCYRALRARKTPKFSRCSGFRIGCVPEELLCLNRIEARLIGLGVSFTTCVNLYRDGQEFTRGNAINYWNEPGRIVQELPRPLRACGVVFLATSANKTTKYFRVRPDLVRRALRWLIDNNPLYEHITISEDNLRALERIDADCDVPTIQLTPEEAQELQGQVRPVNEEEGNGDGVLPDAGTADLNLATASPPPTLNTQRESGENSQSWSGQHSRGEVSCDENTPPQNCAWSACTASCASIRDISNTSSNRDNSSNCAIRNIDRSNACMSSSAVDTDTASIGHDFIDNLNESFELEGNQNSKQSELEKVMNAVGMDAADIDYPIGELRRCENPIDEYNTNQLMQNCFPTLFPDGHAGYHPMNETETREHQYTLTEYCAHLMKWHDRRFVIHGNLKFLCMNLIQRRQIDGLVRRVSVTDSREEAIRTARSDVDDNDTTENDAADLEKCKIQTAMQVLDSLKPFFRVVRGSGLYWSNARDDLMAMIGNRVLPTRWPTFFLTVSAADTIWPDFAKACNPTLTLEECKHLSSADRRRYLVENPDISARHFNRRFQAFFDGILCGKAKPLGEIIDHFWRVEFQQRGSPHIHCLLWIKDAPDVLKLSESAEGRTELAAFVDRSMSVLSKTLNELEQCSCEICTVHREGEIDILAMRPPPVAREEWHCDLSRLVQRVQQHVCNADSACGKKSSGCRFGLQLQ